MKRCFLLLLFCLAFLSSEAGGGWVYMQGKGYFKLTQWWAISPLSYDAFGDITTHMPVGYLNSSIYGEIGLSDRVTGIFFVPFYSRMTLYQVNSDPLVPRESLSSFGDVDISFKYGLITNQTFVSSISVLAGIPFGRTGGGRDQNLATGDGELNLMLRLDGGFSWSIGSLQGWGSFYGGYNRRSLDFNDEWRYGAGVGAKFWEERLMLIGRVDRIDVVGEFDPIMGSIFSNNIEHLSFSGEIGYNFTPKLGLAATLSKPVQGKSFYVSPSYALGLYYNL